MVTTNEPSGRTDVPRVSVDVISVYQRLFVAPQVFGVIRKDFRTVGNLLVVVHAH